MKKRELGTTELRELIELFDSCDAIGRHVILGMARKQAANAVLAPALSLVASRPGLDQSSDKLHRVINHATFALVCNTVNTEQT